MTGVYIFDTELTNRENGEIIEAAWLKVGASDDDDIPSPLIATEEYVERFAPEKPTTFGALAVHSILPSELIGCRPSAEFQLPADAEYIIGHSIDFDHKAAGSPPGVKRICTLAMARRLWPDADSHSQSALLYRLLGATPGTRDLLKDAHSALTDAQNNLRLLQFILHAKPDIRTWSALWAFSEEARVPTHMPMGRNKGQPIELLESGEMEWYLNRGVGDEYLHKAFFAELKRRHAHSSADREELEDTNIPY